MTPSLSSSTFSAVFSIVLCCLCFVVLGCVVYVMLFYWIYTLHQQHLYFSSSSTAVHFPHSSVLCVHRMEMLKALNKLPSLLSSSAQEATFANISPRTLPQFRVEYPIPDILLPPPNIYLTNFLLWKLHVCPSTLPICRGQMTVWVPGQCCRQISLQFGQIFMQFGQIWLQIKQVSWHIWQISSLWKWYPCPSALQRTNDSMREYGLRTLTMLQFW